MPFGDVFSRVEYIDFESADNKYIKFRNNFITRLGFKIFGIPHLGLRLRARKIINNFPKKLKKVLDAGCGTGVYSFTLSNKAKEIYAIDISKKKIDYCRKINHFDNINFEIGNLTKLRYKDNSFDLIICSDVFEHIKDDEKAFKELARTLDYNGTAIITLPINSKANKLNYKLYEHERAGYSLEDIKKWCKKYDLSILNHEYYSSKTSRWLFKIHNSFNNKIFTAALFYPFFALSLIADLFGKEFDGLLIKLGEN